MRFSRWLRWGAAPVLVIASVAAFVWMCGPGDELGGTRSFLSDVPRTLDIEPGKVVYTRYAQYFRYGPSADSYESYTGIATEHRTSEIWSVVGPEGGIVRSYARVLDAEGAPSRVMTGHPETSRLSVADPLSTTYFDPATGEALANIRGLAGMISRRDVNPLVSPGVLQGIGRAMADGWPEVRVIEQTDSELTIELRVELAAPRHAEAPASPGRQGSPYLWDLQPFRGIVWTYTLRQDGVLLASERSLITASGEEVPIQSKTLEIMQVLDGPPAPLPEDGSYPSELFQAVPLPE